MQIFHKKLNIFLFVYLLGVTFSAPKLSQTSPVFINNTNEILARVGDYGYPSDPLLDRAKGYLTAGNAKTAITNYGEYITWDVFPSGQWNGYGYLPHVSFVAGIPGHEYSSKHR